MLLLGEISWRTYGIYHFLQMHVKLYLKIKILKKIKQATCENEWETGSEIGSAQSDS